MATYTKVKLSASTSGAAITVAATASTGTTIHATGTSATEIDEIWLYAYNSSDDNIPLTVQYGGTTAVTNDIKITLPGKSGLTLIVPGLILTGTGAAASTVYAYAGTASVITLSGYVNRIA